MMSRRLHIGGKIRSEGWEVLNANPASYVDHVGNAVDLSRFPDNTFTDIYASHVVEHLDAHDLRRPHEPVRLSCRGTE